VDVAGPGEDETVVTIRHGDVVREMHYFVDRDSRDKVWAVISPYVDYGIHINVDTIGQGYYFAAYLRDQLQARMATQCGVHDVDVGKSPLDKDLYANLKAEAYWKLRERFMQGRVSFNQQDVIGIDGWPIIAKPVEQLDKTIEQLAGIRYEQTDRNLIKIESKKHAKEERGVDSPDGAESLMLCFHDPLQHELQDAGDVGQALADFTGLGMDGW
jgi:phage terminase large subunit